MTYHPPFFGALVELSSSRSGYRPAKESPRDRTGTCSARTRDVDTGQVGGEVGCSQAFGEENGGARLSRGWTARAAPIKRTWKGVLRTPMDAPRGASFDLGEEVVFALFLGNPLPLAGWYL